MFISQIGTNTHYGKMSKIAPIRSSIKQVAYGGKNLGVQPRKDAVTIGSKSVPTQTEREIYNSRGMQMNTLNNIQYTYLAPDEKLKAEILPSSEQITYTEEDALKKQYMKGYRIDGHFEGDSFVRESDEPVKLILPDQINEADLESFRQKLNENGLDEDIDWRGVESDLWNIGVGFDNVERLETKADYLASRYAVLKDRIQNQYTGDRQGSEMERLEKLYTNAKEEMANTYANSIGGFYEDLGQTGVMADMRTSVLAMVDEKAAGYEKHIAQVSDYAKLNDSENQWLKLDDAYMAARLRESAAASPIKPDRQIVDTQAPYSVNDLSFAGAYAKSLSSQLENADQVWDTEQSDSALGEFLAKQSLATQKSVTNAGVSDKLAKLVNNIFDPFIGKFMDALDRSIDKHQELVNKNQWMQGTVRTEHIDRNSVYLSFQNALTNA